MYQPQNYYYHHNLGVAGHRASNSYLQGNLQGRYYGNNYYGKQLPPLQSNFYPPPKKSHPQQDLVVNGGINSVLQYDLNSMSSFLSWCAFGMLKQSRNPSADFENLVVSVLFATRLPSSTVIIALEYMNQRFSSNDDITSQALTEQEIFIYLIVSLVLANKFNDDNTFTNKSWCGATGLDLALLNKHERTWLEECKWSLNVVNFEANILTLEQCWKTWLEKYDRAESYSPIESHHSVPSPSAGYPYPASSPIQSSYYPLVHAQPPVPSYYVNSIPSSPVHPRGWQSPQMASSPISDQGFWRKGNIWNYSGPYYQGQSQPYTYGNDLQYVDNQYTYPNVQVPYAPMSHQYSQQYNPVPYYSYSAAMC